MIAALSSSKLRMLGRGSLEPHKRPTQFPTSHVLSDPWVFETKAEKKSTLPAFSRSASRFVSHDLAAIFNSAQPRIFTSSSSNKEEHNIVSDTTTT